MIKASDKSGFQPSPHQQAVLELCQTSEFLMRKMHEELQACGLTCTQFQALRALAAGPGEGMTCSQLAERMPGCDPDVTRLLDRLGKAGWVVRERSIEDRRVVLIRITEAGKDLAQRLEKPVDEAFQRHLAHLGSEELKALTHLLRWVRVGNPDFVKKSKG